MSLPRERLWDVQVAKIDSPTRQLLLGPAALRPCRSATPSHARRWLRSTPTNGSTALSDAIFAWSLAPSRTTTRQYRLAPSGDYAPSLRSPWRAAMEEFTEEWYEGFMVEWENAVNHYLDTGTKIA